MRAEAATEREAAAAPEPAEGAHARPQSPAHRWRWGAAIALAYCAATVLMTWPLAPRMWNATPPGADPILQVWVARWVQHALATDPLHLYDANAFYPLKDSLAFSDSNVPAALLAWPVYLVTHNPIFASNLLVLGTFVLAAGGMYLLVAHVAGNRAAGFLAGLAYAFLPYRYAHLWHLNQLGHAWTPLVLYALVLLLERRTWRAALAFGLLAAVQVVTSFYVAFQLAFALGIALAVALVADPRARSWRFLGRLAAALGVAAALILPLALPYLQVRDQQGLERTIAEAEKWEATPTSYLKVERRNRAWRWLTETPGGEDALFPGGVALLGAAAGLVGARRRRAATVALLLTAALALVISLGPTWRVTAGGTTPLPYRFLFDHFPFFKAMRVPARFGALVDFAVVALGGLGAAWAWERLAPRLLPRLGPGRGRVAAAALTAGLAGLILLELASIPVPLNVFDRGPQAAAPYEWLARQPDHDPVVEFPITYDDREMTRAMYWSTLHWKPIVQGYSGFIPRSHGEMTNAFRQALKRPDGTVADDVSYVTRENIGLLQDLGIRYVLVHQYGYKREDWPTVVAQLQGAGDRLQKAAEFGELTIYRLQPASEPPPAVSIELFAPSLAVHNIYWEPIFIVRNPSNRPAILGAADFRPSRLTVRWRDERGREVRRESKGINLPAVVPAGETALHLQPDQPAAPGHYTVDLDVTGGLDIHRTVEVDVAERLPAASDEGPPLAFAGASMASDTLHPGDTANLTLDWETRRQPDEDLTIFAQLIGPDGKVWGQYDAPAGWTGHGTGAWLPGERVSLAWPVPLKPDAPPGQYRLLVGMYRHTAAGIERVPVRWPGGDATEYWVGEVAVK